MPKDPNTLYFFAPVSSLASQRQKYNKGPTYIEQKSFRTSDHHIIMASKKVAVLDDYQLLSQPHFDHLREAGYEVTTFTNTLLPYNHPNTPQEAKDALVKRLQPFNIICGYHVPCPWYLPCQHVMRYVL